MWNRYLLLTVILTTVGLLSCNKPRPSEQTEKSKAIAALPKIESYADLVREVDRAVQGPYDYDLRVELIHKAVSFLQSGEKKSIDQLFRLLQNSGAADSESIGGVLSETFYSQPSLIMDSLNTIDSQLLPGFRNDSFRELLIATACSLPMSETESAHYTGEKLAQDKKRILAEVNKSKNASLKAQVRAQVNKITLHHE